MPRGGAPSAAELRFRSPAITFAELKPPKVGLARGALALIQINERDVMSWELLPKSRYRNDGAFGIIQIRSGAVPDEMNEREPNDVTLSISPEKVCFIIVKAREFGAKDELTEPDPGSNPSDDKDISVLEEHEDDPVVEELTSLINSLSEDEQIDLVALMWLGRDDYEAGDWQATRDEAARAHNNRTAEYLIGTPLAGDFLEEGLSKLGYSCEEFELNRL
jgi:hypothetical protein